MSGFYGVWELTRERFDGERVKALLAEGWEPFAATCDTQDADYVFLRRWDASTKQDRPGPRAD